MNKEEILDNFQDLKEVARLIMEQPGTVVDTLSFYQACDIALRMQKNLNDGDLFVLLGEGLISDDAFAKHPSLLEQVVIEMRRYNDNQMGI